MEILLTRGPFCSRSCPAPCSGPAAGPLALLFSLVLNSSIWFGNGLIPQMEPLPPMARSWRKVWTPSAISSAPKLPITQRREECLKSFHHGRTWQLRHLAPRRPWTARLLPTDHGLPLGACRAQGAAHTGRARGVSCLFALNAGFYNPSHSFWFGLGAKI